MVSAVLCNVTVRNNLQLIYTQKGSKGSKFFSFLSLALQSLSKATDSTCQKQGFLLM